MDEIKEPDKYSNNYHSNSFDILPTPSTSELGSINSICIHLYQESDSAVVEDDSFFFREQDLNIHKEEFEEYYNKEDDYEHHGYESYLWHCHKYNQPPIQALKHILDGTSSILDLNNYSVDGLGIRFICDVINEQQTAKIEVLDLSNATIDRTAMEVLSELMQSSLDLKFLNLSNCLIGVENAEILAEGIKASQSIECILLKRCNLLDNGGYFIANSMRYNDFCKILDLSQNKLEIKSGIELGQMLVHNTVLEQLDIGWNELYDEKACVAIMFGLFKNKSLKKLGFSWNGLTGENFSQAFWKAVRRHENLVEVNLEHNRLCATDSEMLSKALRRTKCLQRLYLGGNPLMNDDVILILQHIGKKSQLNFISFGKDYWITKDARVLVEKHKIRDPAVQVEFKGVLDDIPPEPVNFRNILIDRTKYVAMKPKKRRMKRNAGHFMYKLLQQEKDRITNDAFKEIVRLFKIKFDKDLVTQLGEEFIYREGKRKFVSIKKLAQYYLQRHPTDPPPPPISKPKKRKKKDAKKKKK